MGLCSKRRAVRKPYGEEVTLAQALALPDTWTWSSHGGFSSASLADALEDSEPGATLHAWCPQDKPIADKLALDIEDAIQTWCYEDTEWFALSTFSQGEPDGNHLLDSDTFRAGLRALLAAELEKIQVQSYEEAGAWLLVPEEP
jgi:hypothetical protein